MRNNQRNFARITLPWLAPHCGVRRWPDGRCGRGAGRMAACCFLSKSRAGEDAPLFAVEVLHLSAGTPWTEKGRATLALPALDLPVSRTGLSCTTRRRIA